MMNSFSDNLESVGVLRRRLEHFAWLLDSDERDPTPSQLMIFWSWAGEMTALQDQANCSAEPIEYIQRGRILRVLHPEIRTPSESGGTMPMTTPHGTLTVARMVQLWRMSLGIGSTKDTPWQILKHFACPRELHNTVFTAAERDDVLNEAELEIAQDDFNRAKERLENAQLAVELAQRRLKS